jgi:L-amino acid N-acyltransferase YncA
MSADNARKAFEDMDRDMAVIVRPATPGDLAAVSAIYNHYVQRSTCTYQTKPESLDDRRAWFDAHDAAHPVIVAERQGIIVGWASLSRYNPRDGYDRTVDNAVYVHHDAHGQGIGRALLADLIERAKALGHHTIIAMISADQAPSLALHDKLGFKKVAHLSEVGFKFGRWLDVVFMQRMLCAEGLQSPHQ